jgi:hypothetical protein
MQFQGTDGHCAGRCERVVLPTECTCTQPEVAWSSENLWRGFYGSQGPSIDSLYASQQRRSWTGFFPNPIRFTDGPVSHQSASQMAQRLLSSSERTRPSSSSPFFTPETFEPIDAQQACQEAPDLRSEDIDGNQWVSLRFARPNGLVSDADLRPHRAVPSYVDPRAPFVRLPNHQSFSARMPCGSTDAARLATGRLGAEGSTIVPAPVLTPLAIPIGDIIRYTAANGGCVEGPCGFVELPREGRDNPKYRVAWEAGDILDITFNVRLSREVDGADPFDITEFSPALDIDGIFVGVGPVQRGISRPNYETPLIGDDRGIPVALLGAGFSGPAPGQPSAFPVNGLPLARGGRVSFVGNAIAAPFIPHSNIPFPRQGNFGGHPTSAVPGWIPQPGPLPGQPRLPMLSNPRSGGEQNEVASGWLLGRVAPILCNQIRVLVTIASIDLRQDQLPLRQRFQLSNALLGPSGELPTDEPVLVSMVSFQYWTETPSGPAVVQYTADMPFSRWPRAFEGAFRELDDRREAYHPQVSKMALVSASQADRFSEIFPFLRPAPEFSDGLVVGGFSNLRSCDGGSVTIQLSEFEARLRHTRTRSLPTVLPDGVYE